VVVEVHRRVCWRRSTLLYDGKAFREYSAPRVETASTHGTGCVRLGDRGRPGAGMPGGRRGEAKALPTEALRRPILSAAGTGW
jgi:hypothetical protein